MNPRIFLAMVLILLLVPCASAEIINTTILLATDYSGEVQLGNAMETDQMYTYSPPESAMIVFTTIYQRTEGQTLSWELTRAGESSITGTLKTESTSLISGDLTLSINGGSSATLSYPKFLWLMYNPTATLFFVKGDDSYYLVIADNSRFTYAVGGNVFRPVVAPFQLNTTSDCYLEVSGKPSSYPVVELLVVPSVDGNYYVMPYYEQISDVRNAEEYTEDVQESGDIGFFAAILKILGTIIDGAVQIGTYAVALLFFFASLGAFLLGIKVFLGFNVLYFAFAVLLSIEDSDDLFKSFGNLVSRMRKLWKFYMEIFGWLKQIIKWW
jgi:hypothetical protein